MRPFVKSLCLAFLISAVQPIAAVPGGAQSQGLVVVANDLPITEFDITQRINLLGILGSRAPEKASRKAILQDLIDDVVKLSEAKRLKTDVSDSEVTSQIDRIAKNMGMDRAGLLERLKKKGVGTDFFRRYIAAQIGFNRIIAMQHREDVKISPADIDRKMAEIESTANSKIGKIMADPRMKPVTVYSLMQIDLPVENSDPGLLQARAIEAEQVLRQFKGCGSARAAASGVFNVKIGKQVDADAAKLPPPLKSALDKVGTGHAIGPVQGKNSIQLVALCSVRKITPPKPKFEMPTRQQVETALINEKYAGFEEDYLKEARKRVYVEYRDASYSR